jgi:hypothetical protein
MSVMAGLVIAAILVLALITALKVFVVDRRNHEAFGSLQRVTHATTKLVRSILIRHADEDAGFRAQLVKELADGQMLCADCPLRRSSICKDCGRFAAGDGRKV